MHPGEPMYRRIDSSTYARTWARVSPGCSGVKAAAWTVADRNPPSRTSLLPKSRTETLGCPLLGCTKPASRSHCSQTALQAAGGEPGAMRREETHTLIARLSV